MGRSEGTCSRKQETPPAEKGPGPGLLPTGCAGVALVYFPSWSEGPKDSSPLPGPPGTLGVVTVVGEGTPARKSHGLWFLPATIPEAGLLYPYLIDG